MTTHVRLYAVLWILALTACAGSPQDIQEELDPHGDQETLISPIPGVGPADAQGTSPMPTLGARVEHVLEELGDETETARLGAIDGSDTRAARRDRLAALSPRARASLRRHNVRIEQLERQLTDRPSNLSTEHSAGDDR